jgi:1,2-phenylacetyl-CoA epoxidase PaaB subunit
MPRQNKTADTNWRVYFFFTGKSSQRFYTDMGIEAPDARTAIAKAETKLDALDTEMAWGQWAITGCKRDER